jgi:hypothetical protein
MKADKASAIKVMAEQGMTPEAIARDSSWSEGTAPTIVEIKSALSIRKISNPNGSYTINTLLTLGSETRTLAEWTRHRGFGRNTITQRLNAGWSVEDALSIPMKKQRNNNPLA